jgi:hypothetical protein
MTTVQMLVVQIAKWMDRELRRLARAFCQQVLTENGLQLTALSL